MYQIAGCYISAWKSQACVSRTNSCIQSWRTHWLQRCLLNYNDRTIKNNKMSKERIKLISWLIRCWLRHEDNVERLWTHKNHTAAGNTEFLHYLAAVKLLCIVAMTTLGQCWSGFNWLQDNRRRWEQNDKDGVGKRESWKWTGKEADGAGKSTEFARRVFVLSLSKNYAVFSQDVWG